MLRKLFRHFEFFYTHRVVPIYRQVLIPRWLVVSNRRILRSMQGEGYT
jgi:hypothetical protein